MLQPRFEKPAKMRPARDRYRASTLSQGLYEDVEDFDDGGEEEMEFDSFDENLLQQPYPDRRYQAEQGRARLSLAPATSFGIGSQTSRQLQHPQRSRRSEAGWEQEQHFAAPEQAFRDQLNRFNYGRFQPHESSSDAQPGFSSSPALRAGQRRAKHHENHIMPPPQAERECAKLRDLEDMEMPFEPQSLAQQYHVGRQQRGHQQQLLQVQPGDSNLTTQSDQKSRHARPVKASHILPICQGIQLIAVSVLPDRLRTVFPYPNFNAVQSKCFDRVFRSDDNFVLASPTGSGKTVILELALCRAVTTYSTAQYKIVYQAPTKALCAERQRDWAAKFTSVGLKCAELTGDSDATDLRNVQSANIIITTPEKWDSITRKWKDHEKLMRLVKVFLIDEVHILKEDRGAVLEAVVSRMKSIGTDVRFVALSATVPNFQDVAAWLGKNASEPGIPALYEKFGEEFRPVKLQKHVCGYVYQSNNDFGFDKVLDSKLPEVIARYSERKPIMIFCITRKICVSTARLIANWWNSKIENDRLWDAPPKQIAFLNKDLRETVMSGVAFHHAGLELNDRNQVEQGFLNREINIICCTSTLAVGVNLPCHLVIIKNTMAYTNDGLHEYSDLEMMQMLGRAGRPQHDDSAVAVIMTRQAKAQRYELMVSGQELLESKLHLNFIDHLNAEIGLGTIRDLSAARKWLTGTFLYIRLQQNPSHYKLQGARSDQDIEEQVNDICFRDIDLLREHNLVSGTDSLRSTDYGHAMARYYVHFDTMKVFMGLESKASPSEILSAISQASEFGKLRFRSGEKAAYRLLNKSPSIRFSIPVALDLPAHKVSLIIQSVLGSADIQWEGELAKHKNQYAIDTQIVFKSVSGLIRCIIDCQICSGDSISIHSALMIERSLGSQSWDDSPLQLKQINGIGPVAVRKFVNAGIRSMEDLESCDAHRIETLVGRNPPFGMKILELVRNFPKLHVSLHVQPSSIKKVHDGVQIQVKAGVGFMNQKAPQKFSDKLVYVSILAETSDGRKVHFARISGVKLDSGQNLVFPALLKKHDQSINCYVMCDSISGSMRGAYVKPKIAPSMFPSTDVTETSVPQQSNTSKRRADSVRRIRKPSTTSDDFGDDGIDDEALVEASFGDLDFEHIDNFANPTDAITRRNTVKNNSTKPRSQTNPVVVANNDFDQESMQLANGKWACNHKCKDKAACKHLCCKEGMDKPPKKTTATKHQASAADASQSIPNTSTQKPKATQTKLQLTAQKRKTPSVIEELDLTKQDKKRKSDSAKNGPKHYHELNQLHKTIQRRDPPSTLHSVMNTKPEYCFSEGGEHNLSFMSKAGTKYSETSSDYGEVQLDEESLYSYRHSAADKGVEYVTNAPINSQQSDTFGDDDSLLGDAMIGLADSQNLRETRDNPLEHSVQHSGSLEDAQDDIGHDEDYFAVGDVTEGELLVRDEDSDEDSDDKAHPNAATKGIAIRKSGGPFLCAISSPQYCGNNGVNTNNQASKSMDPISYNVIAIDSERSDSEISGRRAKDEIDNEVLNMLEESPFRDENTVPEGLEGLEPWFYQEFGHSVQLIDE